VGYFKVLCCGGWQLKTGLCEKVVCENKANLISFLAIRLAEKIISSH
jgi:hypothetical protein